MLSSFIFKRRQANEAILYAEIPSKLQSLKQYMTILIKEQSKACQQVKFTVRFNKYCQLIIQTAASMEPLDKQEEFKLENGIVFSSRFESGNLAKVQLKEPYTYHLWIGADPKSTYRTWFYFSVENATPGNTFTFCLVNMSNQVKLFKEGHLPVFRSQQDSKWNRIPQPIQQNGISRGEQGFQLTFRHTFSNKSKHYFAFSYPWTYTENNLMIRNLVQSFKDRYFCDYRQLCLSTKKVELNILTITKPVSKDIEIKQFKQLQDYECFTFTGKKGIFISARVHPGEVASSHICNGLIKYLFSNSSEAEILLQNFVFYIVPVINPDGVIDGNFRCDSKGKNLNRFYSSPSRQQQPEIFSIKAFLLQMILSKKIHFCLDLHAHVNKQGVFMYGNSTGKLKDQLEVCLFPKLLQYNCKYFDYQSCNFSEKNMSSKDKGDDLSKEGASRVAVYKETGLPSCWTLECNYNSAKWTNLITKPVQEEPNSKAVSHSVILDINSPQKKEENALLNVKEFEEIGTNIAETLLDYYKLRAVAPYFSSRLKNSVNFQLSLSVNILRMIPFKFDNDSRKILNEINNGQCLSQNFGKVLMKIGQDPVMQYLSSRSMKEKSTSKQKTESRIQSVKAITRQKDSVNKDSVQKRETKGISLGQRDKLAGKKTIIIPNIPKIPRKK